MLKVGKWSSYVKGAYTLYMYAGLIQRRAFCTLVLLFVLVIAWVDSDYCAGVSSFSRLVIMPSLKDVCWSHYASHLHLLSQESRRKDLGGSSSKSAPSSSSVKIPAAHSTSPGLAPAPVSTTTSAARRTKRPGEVNVYTPSLYNAETYDIWHISID